MWFSDNICSFIYHKWKTSVIIYYIIFLYIIILYYVQTLIFLLSFMFPEFVFSAWHVQREKPDLNQNYYFISDLLKVHKQNVSLKRQKMENWFLLNLFLLWKFNLQLLLIHIDDFMSRDYVRLNKYGFLLKLNQSFKDIRADCSHSSLTPVTSVKSSIFPVFYWSRSVRTFLHIILSNVNFLPEFYYQG